MLKGMSIQLVPVVYNLAKFKIIFEFFVLMLGLRLRRHPPKKFLETRRLFFQPKFPEKARVLSKLDTSCGVTVL